MPRYTLCPYFEYEYGKRITCEDVYRRFDDEQSKWSWMDMYCDSNWMSCPYAIELNEAYERLEKGDKMAVEEHKKEALKKELDSTAMKLGRVEKKLARTQKKLDEAKALNRSFIMKNERVEKQKRTYYEMWKSAVEQLQEYERRIDDQIQQLARIYEARIAYLMQTYADGQLWQKDVDEWLEENADFGIIADENEEQRLWKVVIKENESEEPDEPGRVQGTCSDGEAGKEEEVPEQSDRV